MMPTTSHAGLDSCHVCPPINLDHPVDCTRWVPLICGACVIAATIAGLLRIPRPNSQADGMPVVAAHPASFKSPVAVLATPAVELPAEMTSRSTRMTLVLVRAGSFQMGSPIWESERHHDEGPQQTVGITKPFYLGAYEVTQAVYHTVMSRNPSGFSHMIADDETDAAWHVGQFPVEQVSWFDAIDFCNRLSARDDRPAYYRLTNTSRMDGSIESTTVTILGGIGYRLPTEAEWEYACRASTETPFEFGNQLNGVRANIDGGSPYGTTESGPTLRRTTAVGSYPQNGFGLFDMHGNVAEWCEDVYDENAYALFAGIPRDQSAARGGDSYRVARGGSWASGGNQARAASRHMYFAGHPESTVGIRVACTAADAGVPTPLRKPAIVASSQK